MHTQHHQVRAMNEHREMPSYKNIMKQYQDKVASINFRHDMLLRQRNANYQNERQWKSTYILVNVVSEGYDIKRFLEKLVATKSKVFIVTL